MANKVKQIFRIVEFRNQVNVTAQFVLRGQLIQVVQHAEIERNEIIFTKGVTEELERLYKDGSDEAAIQAGKLIAKQIIENTQDNTGLISEVQV